MQPRTAENTLVAEELGRLEFERLGGEWDQLVARSGRDEPFWRHAWLRVWLDNFAPGRPLRLIAVRAGRALVAALPLLEERATMYGVPLRRLRAPANVHSNRFDLVCEPGRPDALEALWSHLRATQRFDVLELPDVPPDAALRPLVALAEKDGLRTGSWESMRSPYVPLEGGMPAVLQRLDARFKSNLRRRRRKLEERGRVELQRVDGGPDLERYLEEGFALERSGWKGRDGTAIACDRATRGFYAELAREAAGRGELALYFLRLDGRAIGFHFGLVHGTTYYLPKMAYDEEQKECSPGQLLTEAVLRDCCERGLRAFDFLGPSMPWKSDWTDAVRVHQWVYIFGESARAAAVHELKFGWAPAVREVLRWRR